MSGKTKYAVGDVFYDKRRIVEYCGSHPKWRVSMWKWECLGCGTIHGPDMTATLTRKDRENSLPRCCYKKRTFGLNSSNWSGYEELPYTYWTQVRYGAEKRGIEFSLSMEDMWKQYESQNKKCALTGLDIPMKYKAMIASLDRIDSSLGYTIDNIQWVHKDINKMKTDFTQERFIELCKAVANENLVSNHSGV